MTSFYVRQTLKKYSFTQANASIKYTYYKKKQKGFFYIIKKKSWPRF